MTTSASETKEMAFSEMQQAVADAGFITGYLGASAPRDVAEQAERLNRWVLKLAHQIIAKTYELPR